MKLTEAIILAGGFGTRLQSVVNEVPKPMAPINGKPFLEYLMDHLIEQGISDVIFSVGYMADIIYDHFQDCYNDCSIRYVHEEEPLGTGGAILEAMKDAQKDDVLVTNGDSLFITNLQEQYQFHKNNKADATLALKPMQNFERYGAVVVDKDIRITDFREKQPMEQGLINGGVYIFNRATFIKNSFPEKFSIEKEYFQACIESHRFMGFKSDGYFLDIGIPQDFKKAQTEFLSL